MDPQEDLLSEFHEELNQQLVSVSTRFANGIIDSVIYYIIFLMIIQLMSHDSPGVLRAGGFLTVVGYVVYLFYYTILEGAAGGRTIGKMITGSRAIKNDGGDITWNDAALRSLSRLVPFEALSAFAGMPWHDTWTKTKVVKNMKQEE